MIMSHIDYSITPNGFGVFGNVYAKWDFHNLDQPLVFTFASAEENDRKSILSVEDAEKGIDPWGFNLFKNMGLNVVSFASVEQPSWYRSEEFYSFMYQLNIATAKFRVRLGYGISMGGFGVAAFSNTLGIQRLLLLYPVASKKLDLAPWIKSDEQALRLYDWSLGCVDAATSYSEGIILYDPLFKRDAKAVDRFSKRFSRIRCSGLKHGFAGTLVPSGILSDLIHDFVTDTTDVVSIQRRINKARRFMPYYYNKILTTNLSINRAAIFKKYRSDCLIEGSSVLEVSIKIKNLLERFETDQAILLSEAHGRDDSFADIFRDVALSYEEDNLSYAIKLMKYAQKIRPSGPFINTRLECYMRVVAQ